MGSLDPNPAKERLAGFVTLAAILFGTLLIVVVTQVDWRPYTQYRLVFSLLQDASGIQPGVPVEIGGIHYGKVLRVETGPMLDDAGNVRPNAQNPDSPNANILGTFVTFELDSKVPLWSSARISRNATVLGGNVSIQIYDTGFELQNNPQAAGPNSPLIANATIRASNPPSGFTTIFGGPVALKLDQMYANFTLFYDWFTQHARKEIVAQFQSINASINSLRDSVKNDSNDWQARFASLKSNTSEMNRRLGISNEGEQDPTSYSSIIKDTLPQIHADATSAQSDYTAVAAEIKIKSARR